MLGSFVIPVPARQRLGRAGIPAADALLQSLNLVLDQDPVYVIVFHLIVYESTNFPAPRRSEAPLKN